MNKDEYQSAQLNRQKIYELAAERDKTTILNQMIAAELAYLGEIEQEIDASQTRDLSQDDVPQIPKGCVVSVPGASKQKALAGSKQQMTISLKKITPADLITQFKEGNITCNPPFEHLDKVFQDEAVLKEICAKINEFMVGEMKRDFGIPQSGERSENEDEVSYTFTPTPPSTPEGQAILVDAIASRASRWERPSLGDDLALEPPIPELRDEHVLRPEK
jgi:hypothetical protein